MRGLCCNVRRPRRRPGGGLGRSANMPNNNTLSGVSRRTTARVVAVAECLACYIVPVLSARLAIKRAKAPNFDRVSRVLCCGWGSLSDPHLHSRCCFSVAQCFGPAIQTTGPKVSRSASLLSLLLCQISIYSGVGSCSISFPSQTKRLAGFV